MIRFLTHLKNRNFLRLYLAQLISQFGDRIHQLALVGLIAERSSGSEIHLAKILAFTILPVFIVQPIAGVFVDRWNRRITLFVCDVARGVLVLLIPLIFIYWHSIIPIYIIVFVVFSFSRFYIPAKMSLIPDLVEEKDLITANSFVSTTGMIAFCLGAALGGFFIDWWGARSGFIIDSVTFFISATLLITMNLKKRLRETRKEWLQKSRQLQTVNRSVWAEIKEGFLYLKKHKEINTVVNMLYILMSACGAIYIVIIVFIQHSFHSVTKDLGLIAVSVGIGLFCGVLLYGKWGRNIRWNKTIFGCLGLSGLMIIVFALVVYYFPHLTVAMGMAFCLGMVIGPVFISANTVVHIVTDEAMRGKVFSALEIVIHFGFLTTMFLSSWLSKFIGEVWVLTAAGGIVSIVGFVGLISTRKDSTFALKV